MYPSSRMLPSVIGGPGGCLGLGAIRLAVGSNRSLAAVTVPTSSAFFLIMLTDPARHLTCPMFWRILPQSDAAGHTPVSLVPTSGRESAHNPSMP